MCFSMTLRAARASILPDVAVPISNLPFFFFNDTATTEIYTLSLHDALPICGRAAARHRCWPCSRAAAGRRSEEHTSELQSRRDLVCRLLLEKKKEKEMYVSMWQNKVTKSQICTVLVKM